MQELKPEQIITKSCEFFKIDENVLKSRLKKKYISDCRHMICDMLYSNRMNLTNIAKIMNRKDHTTIIYAIKKVGNLVDVEPSFREKYIELHKSVYGTLEFYKYYKYENN